MALLLPECVRSAYAISANQSCDLEKLQTGHFAHSYAASDEGRRGFCLQSVTIPHINNSSCYFWFYIWITKRINARMPLSPSRPSAKKRWVVLHAFCALIRTLQWPSLPALNSSHHPINVITLHPPQFFETIDFGHHYHHQWACLWILTLHQILSPALSRCNIILPPKKTPLWYFSIDLPWPLTHDDLFSVPMVLTFNHSSLPRSIKPN